MIQLSIKPRSNPDAIEAVHSAIDSEIDRLKHGLNRTNERIKHFEQKYKVKSTVFLRSWSAEMLNGKDSEYVEWMGEVKVLNHIQARLSQLQDIVYADR